MGGRNMDGSERLLKQAARFTQPRCEGAIPIRSEHPRNRTNQRFGPTRRLNAA